MLFVNLCFSQFEGRSIRTKVYMLIHRVECLRSAQEQCKSFIVNITVDPFGHFDKLLTIDLGHHLSIKFVELRQLRPSPESTVMTEELPVNSSRRSFGTEVEPTKDKYIPGWYKLLFYKHTRASQ